MQIRVSDIPEDGLRVTDAAEFRATFAEEGWNLHRVEILVTRQGTEVGVQGVFEAGAPMVCSRCLEPWVLGVGSSLDVKLCPRPPRSRREEHELGRDDLEVDFYADG
ncbi:MAG TPA: hypothetical protein VLA62_06375, partial [Solirubrobacterales bacterium]|nr:hypothetical protein [Solirubrobacterales bacterium]